MADGIIFQEFVWKWQIGWPILSLNYREKSYILWKILSGLKIIRHFVKVDWNYYKTANKSISIHTYQIVLS